MTHQITFSETTDLTTVNFCYVHQLQEQKNVKASSAVVMYKNSHSFAWEEVKGHRPGVKERMEKNQGGHSRRTTEGILEQKQVTISHPNIQSPVT